MRVREGPVVVEDRVLGGELVWIVVEPGVELLQLYVDDRPIVTGGGDLGLRARFSDGDEAGQGRFDALRVGSLGPGADHQHRLAGTRREFDRLVLAALALHVLPEPAPNHDPVTPPEQQPRAVNRTASSRRGARRRSPSRCYTLLPAIRTSLAAVLVGFSASFHSLSALRLNY